MMLTGIVSDDSRTRSRLSNLAAPPAEALLDHRVRDHRAVRAVHRDHVREARRSPSTAGARGGRSSGELQRPRLAAERGDDFACAVAGERRRRPASISDAASRPLSPRSEQAFLRSRAHPPASCRRAVPRRRRRGPRRRSSPTARAAWERTKKTSSASSARRTCCTSDARLAPSTRAAAERTVPDGVGRTAVTAAAFARGCRPRASRSSISAQYLTSSARDDRQGRSGVSAESPRARRELGRGARAWMRAVDEDLKEQFVRRRRLLLGGDRDDRSANVRRCGFERRAKQSERKRRAAAGQHAECVRAAGGCARWRAVEAAARHARRARGRPPRRRASVPVGGAPEPPARPALGIGPVGERPASRRRMRTSRSWRTRAPTTQAARASQSTRSATVALRMSHVGTMGRASRGSSAGESRPLRPRRARRRLCRNVSCLLGDEPAALAPDRSPCGSARRGSRCRRGRRGPSRTRCSRSPARRRAAAGRRLRPRAASRPPRVLRLRRKPPPSALRRS